MKLNFITNASKYVSGKASFFDVKPIIERAETFAKKTIQSTQTYRTLAQIFKPKSNIYIGGSPIQLGFPLPPTTWSATLKTIISPTSTSRIFSHAFTPVSQVNTITITDLTFGVPPEYLTPTTLAGKQYINNLEELFRFFKIIDVGLLRLPQHGDAKRFWVFEFISAWRNQINVSVSEGVTLSFEDVVSKIMGEPVSLRAPEIKFALNTNEFTFGFSNQYQDTFLQQFNNIMSGTARQIIQIGGLASLSDIGNAIKNFLNSFGPFGDWLARAFNVSKEQLANLLQKSTLLNQLAQGRQVVFPKVWSGSTFTNAYNVRFTLYSLSRDEREIRRKILLPLAILLALSTPIAPTSPYFYQYPFVFKGEIEGLRAFDAAVITDMRLSFGGERSVFDADKTYLAIDVELSIQDVYDVMVTSMTDSVTVTPTTTKWFQYIKRYLTKGETTYF